MRRTVNIVCLAVVLALAPSVAWALTCQTITTVLDGYGNLSICVQCCNDAGQCTMTCRRS